MKADWPVTCSTGEVVRSYEQYLRTRHWDRMRRSLRKSELAKNGCAVCGNPYTDAHHKTYERLGNERLEDLLPLCQPCHSLLHEDRELSTQVAAWYEVASTQRAKPRQPSKKIRKPVYPTQISKEAPPGTVVHSPSDFFAAAREKQAKRTWKIR